MAIRRLNDKSITLKQLLFLMKRLKLILLTFLIKLKISTLLYLYALYKTTNLDSLPLIYLHHTRRKRRREEEGVIKRERKEAKRGKALAKL